MPNDQNRPEAAVEWRVSFFKETMDSIEALKERYAGDQAWDAFVSAAYLEGADKAEVEHLSQKLADVEISAILVSTLGGQAATWLASPCKALDHAHPMDVLHRDKFGPQIIKALLMRMPR